MSAKSARTLIRVARFAWAWVLVPLSIAPAHGASVAAKTHSSGYAHRADVQMFVTELSAEQFDRKQLLRWFADAQFQPKIIAAMERPIAEPPKWFEYAPQFLSAERIEGGVAYFRAHEADLARAEREFGVPAEIIVAIIGVETFYGK